MRIFLIVTLFIFSISFNLNAESGHSDHKEKPAKPVAETHDDHADHDEKEEKHDDHADHDEKEEKHVGHDEHGEEGHGEENPQVGQGKGITVASEEDGIKLSPEATKNFEIVLAKIEDLKSIKIPKKAIVTAGEEINVFRYRDGFYKRIDFDLINQNHEQVHIRSKDFKSGDQIVVGGTGFLRIAEIAAFGGAPTGHSH